MKRKFLLPIFMLLTVLLLGSEIAGYHGLAYAKSAGHGEQAADNTHGDGHGNDKASDNGHGEAADSHGGGHHPAPPFIYYIYWVLLLVALARAVKFLKAHQDAAKAQKLAEISGVHDIHEEHETHDAHGDHDAHVGHDDHGDDHGHHPEPSLLDKFLVGCVVMMFIFEQVPSLAHFHEANSLGFVKFLLKAGLGVSLMTYGILGMGEH